MPDASLGSKLREIFTSIAFDAHGNLRIDSAPVIPPAGTAEFSPHLHHISPRLAHLHAELYARYYSVATAAPAPLHDGPSLVAQLSAANAGRSAWDPAWTLVTTVPDGRIAASKGDTRCTFAPGHYIRMDVQRVAVHLPHEHVEPRGAFYHVLGDVPSDDRELAQLVRVYWNIEERGAASLVSAVTDILNRYRVPFRFKILVRAGAFVRSDAAVLYFAKRWFPAVARLLPAIRERVRGALREATPLFTRRIDDGIALAEDPGPGDSFGMHRTRILAASIWMAAPNVEARMAKLEELFAHEGLSLERPWLNAGSWDWYDMGDEAA